MRALTWSEGKFLDNLDLDEVLWIGQKEYVLVA